MDGLLREPTAYAFFQALRMLEHDWAGDALDTEPLLAQRLRFGNSLSLSFPSSEIESFAALDDPASFHVADEDARVPARTDASLAPVDAQRFRMVPAFIGLLGAQGALPAHYTEKILERESRYRDRTPRAFLDIFTSRLGLLFYLAWKKHRPEIDLGRGCCMPVLRRMAALAGHGDSKTVVGTAHVRPSSQRESEPDVVPSDDATARFAGLLRERSRSPDVSGRVLSDYFGVEIQVEPFVGGWYDVPAQEVTALGVTNAGLGAGALVGARVWQADLRIRLWIGPLDADRFADFLPDGRSSRSLRQWLDMLGHDTVECEVRLSLERGCVDALKLKSDGHARLGWNAYLCAEGASTTRSDTQYLINAIDGH